MTRLSVQHSGAMRFVVLAAPEELEDSWVEVLSPGFHELAAAFE